MLYEVITKDKFNPVMNGDDLLAFRNRKAVDPVALNYIERIKTSDHIVITSYSIHYTKLYERFP